jgi:Phage integrase family
MALGGPAQELGTSVFIIPGRDVKQSGRVGGAQPNCSVRDRQQAWPSSQGRVHLPRTPLRHTLNSAWKKARVRAGLEHVRVHDIKHTFGRRLRAAGMSFEDRQDLLGHLSGESRRAIRRLICGGSFAEPAIGSKFALSAAISTSARTIHGAGASLARRHSCHHQHRIAMEPAAALNPSYRD